MLMGQPGSGLERRRFVVPWDTPTVAALPDGSRALTGSSDGTVCLWDLETGDELRRFGGHGDAVTELRRFDGGGPALVALEDGKALFSSKHVTQDVKTGSEWVHCVIHFCDVDTGAELVRYVGHQGCVFWCSSSKSGAGCSLVPPTRPGDYGI